MAGEPFHKTGIAVRAGMLTPGIRIDDIVIDLGDGENSFCVSFFDNHSCFHVLNHRKVATGLLGHYPDWSFTSKWIEVYLGTTVRVC
jgi:hypothetical protein